MELTTPRLRLREFRFDDFATAYAYASDPEVTKHMLFGPGAEESTRQFLASVVAQQAESPRTAYEMAIELRASGVHIGGIGLRTGKRSDMGYILRRDQWGRGYATEAGKAMLGFAFRNLKLHRIIATCDAHNIGSCRVLEKLGMRREGHFRQDVLVHGAWRDSYLHALLAEERKG